LKNLRASVFFSTGLRRRISTRRSGSLKNFSHSRFFPLCALCVLTALCINFHRLRLAQTGRRSPPAAPPAQPSETPRASAEAAKRSTDVPENSSASANSGADSEARQTRAHACLLPVTPKKATPPGTAFPFHGRHASNGEVLRHVQTHRRTTAPSRLNHGPRHELKQWQIHRGAYYRPRPLRRQSHHRSFARRCARSRFDWCRAFVPVRVEVLGGVDPPPVFFTVQVGAFRDPHQRRCGCATASAPHTRPFSSSNMIRPTGCFIACASAKSPAKMPRTNSASSSTAGKVLLRL